MLFCSTFAGILFYLTTANGDCGVIPKAEWDGFEPRKVDYLPRPVDLVIIAHANSRACTTVEQCTRVVRCLQCADTENVQLRANDVKSSFIVGGNGKIYEGRGWMRAGADVYYPNRAVLISFTGDYTDDITTQSLDAVKALLACGVAEGHLSTDYKLMVRVNNFDSYLIKLYAIVKLWPHFTLPFFLPPS